MADTYVLELFQNFGAVQLRVHSTVLEADCVRRGVSAADIYMKGLEATRVVWSSGQNDYIRTKLGL